MKIHKAFLLHGYVLFIVIIFETAQNHNDKLYAQYLFFD